MNKSISKKKIIKYVYKINKSINCSNDKLNSYLKHLNYHGKQNYNMIGGDFVEDKITELNNLPDCLIVLVCTGNKFTIINNLPKGIKIYRNYNM